MEHHGNTDRMRETSESMDWRLTNASSTGSFSHSDTSDMNKIKQNRKKSLKVISTILIGSTTITLF